MNASHTQRSRNSTAQARHREKRKAYMEQVCHILLVTDILSFKCLSGQLEMTVTKLWLAYGYPSLPDHEDGQVLHLNHTPLLVEVVKIQQEVDRHRKENAELHCICDSRRLTVCIQDDTECLLPSFHDLNASLEDNQHW